jgi:hypothetical protein
MAHAQRVQGKMFGDHFTCIGQHLL